MLLSEVDESGERKLSVPCSLQIDLRSVSMEKKSIIKNVAVIAVIIVLYTILVLVDFSRLKNVPPSTGYPKPIITLYSKEENSVFSYYGLGYKAEYRTIKQPFEKNGETYIMPVGYEGKISLFGMEIAFWTENYHEK